MGYIYVTLRRILVSTKSRTIDNLGVDISVRYAQDKELQDTKFIEESRSIPKFIEQSVLTPYYPSELDILFGVEKRNAPWADFIAPLNFFQGIKNLFSFQLIPSLGPIEKQEEEKQKITDYKKKKKKKKLFSREEEEEEKERDVLISLFSCLLFLDKNLESTNAKRGQYQKG